MKNSELELYTDYLLSSFGATTATGLSAMVQGDVSAALKDNRLVALSQEDWKKKRFVRVDKLEFPEQSAVQGWLKGSVRAVRLVRQVFKNQDSSNGVIARRIPYLTKLSIKV